jgi:hypothetical protein
MRLLTNIGFLLSVVIVSGGFALKVSGSTPKNPEETTEFENLVLAVVEQRVSGLKM